MHSTRHLVAYTACVMPSVDSIRRESHAATQDVFQPVLTPKHFNINIKSDKTKVKQYRRDFRRGNYKEIRKSLALIDGNDKMNNKTATECWNVFRGELDRAIDSYVPMKMQGKRSKKKHLSKEAFRKIRSKQNMWRVYKHTGTDKDYDAYKEALNAATNEEV